MAEAVDLKKWYVVRAVSGQENKIRDYMESEINRLGFNNMVEDILVPTQKVIQIRTTCHFTTRISRIPCY